MTTTLLLFALTPLLAAVLGLAIVAAPTPSRFTTGSIYGYDRAHSDASSLLPSAQHTGVVGSAPRYGSTTSDRRLIAVGASLVA